MTHLTEDETHVLRYILGLNKFNKTNATRNYSNGLNQEKYGETMVGLDERGYLTLKFALGHGGKEYYYSATPAGIEAVRDQPWQ